MGYKSAILALIIAATVGLVITAFSIAAAAEVESGKELDKIRNREIRSGQECDTNTRPVCNTTPPIPR